MRLPEWVIQTISRIHLKHHGRIEIETLHGGVTEIRIVEKIHPPKNILPSPLTNSNKVYTINKVKEKI